MCDTNTLTAFQAAQKNFKASANAWMNTQREIARLEQRLVDMDDPVKIQEWISNAIDNWKNDNPPPEASGM